MGAGGHEKRSSLGRVARDTGELATMAEAAVGMSVLVASDAVAVAGVDEAIPVACITLADKIAVDVAAGAEDHSRCCVISRLIAAKMAIALS